MTAGGIARGSQESPGQQRDRHVPQRRGQQRERAPAGAIPVELVDEHRLRRRLAVGGGPEQPPQRDQAADDRHARAEPQGPPPARPGRERVHEADREGQEAGRALRPEGEAGAAVEADPPRAGRLERHPHQHPDAGGDEAGHEGVGHREMGGEEQPLGGHREEGREAAGLRVEQVARERIGEQHGGDHRGGGGKHRGPLRHPPDRPGGQRDQPGEERWLVEVPRPVEPGPEPVAAREDVLGEQREAGQVVGGEARARRARAPISTAAARAIHPGPGGQPPARRAGRLDKGSLAAHPGPPEQDDAQRRSQGQQNEPGSSHGAPPVE